MTGYRTGLEKRAGWKELLDSTKEMATGASKVLKDSAFLLVSAGATTGALIGWGLAKSTRKGVGDIDSTGKMYELQRLDKDIAYLQARLAEESRQRKAQQQQTQVRDAGILRV